MYGRIGKILAVPGQRDVLAGVLLEGLVGMPGCRSYVVARDPTEPDALWVTEVWDDAAHHQASLALPSVRAAIARGRHGSGRRGPRRWGRSSPATSRPQPCP